MVSPVSFSQPHSQSSTSYTSSRLHSSLPFDRRDFPLMEVFSVRQLHHFLYAESGKSCHFDLQVPLPCIHPEGEPDHRAQNQVY